MSTKVYNGYKLEGVRTLAEMDVFIKRLQKRIHKAQETLTVRKLASLAAKFYDMQSLGWVKRKQLKKHKGQTPLTYAFMTMMEKQSEIKKTGHRNRDFDFEFEVAFIFQKGYTLCALFTERDEFTTIWESMRGVKKYFYWDNSDRPKNLTSAAWRKRRDDWNKAMGHSTYAEAGVVKTIAPPYINYEDKAAILRAVPTLSRRLEYYAKDIVIHSYPGERVSDGQINWSVVRESMDFIRTDKGKESVLNAKKNLRSRLVKRFTIKLLTEPVRSTLVRAN